MTDKICSVDKISLNERFLLVVVSLLCIAILGRYQISNGFSVLFGDRYDVVIEATILEHWYQVFRGMASWSEVNYFYPYTRTIAQTDAYFLLGIAYLPFRVFGLDPFLSTEFAGFLTKLVGFLGVYFFSWRVFDLSSRGALLAAALFTLSNGMTSHSQRLQLSTVAFAPILGLFLWQAFKALYDGVVTKFRVWGLCSGVFFGAWCLTCFYMAWFFIFFLTAFFVSLLLVSQREELSVWWSRLKSYYGSVLLVLLSSVFSLIPFVYAYLPKSREVGVRTYETVASNTIPIEGILQVGRGNYLFGNLYNKFLTLASPTYSPSGEYYNTGFSFALFFVFASACIHFIRKIWSSDTRKPFHALIIATLFTWGMTLNIGGHTAWYWVYHFFPGAKALNVVAAYQLFLALPVTIIAVKYLAEQRSSQIMFIFIALFLVVGELNTPYMNFNRKLEVERITLKGQPPASCKSFYVSGWNSQEEYSGFPEWINAYYAHNVSAMLISQLVHVPTINGIASFNQPDWNFGFPNLPDYNNRVLDYARKHKITNLCCLDLNSKQWSIVKP
jgi:hypothetical protein